MPEDFDIDALARYLHLTPAQVTRMAERGQLPGRRIGGQWRFAQADIHHWWEERIGLLDDSELAAVEGVLQRDARRRGTDDERISIDRLIPPDAIAVPLAARTRNSVISELIELAAATGLLWDAARMADAVRVRENLHPTALDNGVALLHPRRPLAGILGEPFIVFGRTDRGIPFGNSKGVLTDLYFLICSTDDQTHLRVLARLSRLVGDAAVLDRIRSAPDAIGVREVLAEAEGQLPD